MTQTQFESSRNPLLKWWARLSGLPGGAWIFSRLFGWIVPYSGSIRPRIEAIKPGYARVGLADRRAVRNHLKSIHAIALVNLGEIATGLAVISSSTDRMRAILVKLDAEYLKKARGRLTATAEFELPRDLQDNTAFRVEAQVKDQSGDLVTIIKATWLVGYKPL